MDAQLGPNLPFLLVLVVITLATAVKGALGFGFPLIAVPIAATLIGARAAVTLIAIPVVFSNLLVLTRGGGTADQGRLFAGMLVSVALGAVIGAQLLQRLDPEALSVIVGITSILFALMGLVELVPSVPPRWQAYAGPVVGIVSGIMGGTTGIFAPLLAAYLHSLRLEKRPFTFWLTTSFFVGAAAQVLSYARLGLYTGRMVWYALAACVPVLVGTRLGFWIQDRLPEVTFRRLVMLLVLLTGLNLVRRGLT